MKLKLTPARQRGLTVLAAAERQHGGVSVRVSNVTTAPSTPLPRIYWQVAYWLRDNSLATITGSSEGDLVVRLTEQGRKVAADLNQAAR